MPISPKPPLFLLLTLTILAHSSAANDSDRLLSYLHSLRSQSPSTLIHLNETLLDRIFKSGPKSFHLVLFFDARKLHNQPGQNLILIKSEFTLISKSFLINNHNSSSLYTLFFCDIELDESKTNFLRFNVNSLPDIRVVPPDSNDVLSNLVVPIPMDIVHYAESMATFINLKTGVMIGAIHRPPILTNMQLMFVIVGFVIWIPYMIKKVIACDTIFHIKKNWIYGTLFVYFFSVSGTMFILIRGIPLFVMDRTDPNKLKFFFQGHGMQFGAEGLCVGFMFMVVGLMFSLVTRVVVRMEDSMMQRVTMAGAMIVVFWAVKQVVVLNHWKTGYAIHAYLPSSWYK